MFTITLEQFISHSHGGHKQDEGEDEGDENIENEASGAVGLGAIYGGQEIQEKSDSVSASGANNTSRERMVSRLTFVDLAGSERIKRTGAEGQRLKEVRAYVDCID